MRKYAVSLEFISEIKRDGTGVKQVLPSHVKFLEDNNEYFDLFSLSTKENTYVAHGLKCYVVKLKSNYGKKLI
jgi:hypothetical protein